MGFWVSILGLTILGLASRVLAGCGYTCQQSLKDTQSIYYLNKLNREESNPYKVKDIVASIKSEAVKGVLSFNICGEVNVPEGCNSENLQASAYFLAEDGRCIAMSSSADTNWKIESLEGKKEPDGIKFTADNSKNRDRLPNDIQYQLFCDREKITPVFTAEQKGSFIVVSMRAKDACGKDLIGPLADIFGNPYIVYPAMIVLGLILGPFGIRVYRGIIAIVGFLAG